MDAEASPLSRAMDDIDAIHREDPETEHTSSGPVPKELLYAQRMSAWLERLAPDASEPLRLAVRAQHLRRWAIPRDAYPQTRSGYKRWRSELARRHAEEASAVLERAGYDEETRERAKDLILKKRLRTDREAQLLEDVVCLVFLQHYFAEFAAKHDDGKVVQILRKTWSKMSERGHEQALALELAPRERALVERALAPEPETS
jgi:hypothetical protein